MRLNLRFCLPLVAMVMGVVAVQAGGLYRLEPRFTQISFTVNNLGGLFSTTGQFKVFDGKLLLDVDNPASGQVDVTARADSVSTGWVAADDMLNSADYLDPQHFPEIHFVSTRIEVQSPDYARLHGRLTLRGVTRDQTFEAHLQGRHDDQAWKSLADYVVEGQINRGEFGMIADPSLVGEVITVRIAARVQLEPAR